MKNISDEFLNAFVDHELESNEKSELFDSIEREEALKARVCELRGLKELVQHAYLQPPTYISSTRKKMFSWPHYMQTLAACFVLILFGGVSGWAISANSVSGNDHKLIKLLQAVQSNANVNEPAKIIVQVSSANPVRLKMALDETESLLEHYRLANRPLKMEVIANGDGVNLVRSDVSPYVARIAMMKAKYKNLDFVACNQTIAGLLNNGVVVRLLPNIRIATSAFDEINMRILQGWDYVRV